MAESYAVSLAKYPVETVDKALTKHIESPESGFMPSVGRLIELIHLHKPPVSTYSDPNDSSYCRECSNSRWVIAEWRPAGKFGGRIPYVRRCGACRKEQSA